jgi:hypothetical protein
MDFLGITWLLWLILSGLCIGGVLFYRRSRKGASNLLISAQDLSVKTLMLDVRKGDGDIFLGYLLSMLFFSLFLAGIARWVRTLFGG